MNLAEATKVLERISPPSGLMRVTEAAMLTGHNPETLRRRIRRGELRAWGRPYRVAISDVLPMFMPAACGK
jgi:hypothetical protein